MLLAIRRAITATAAILGAFGATGAEAQERTPEQEVLAFMIARYGRDAVVSDSTWAEPCERFWDTCRPALGVPVDAWAAYLLVSREPALMADLLPPDVNVTFTSEHVDDPRTPCSERKHVLTLSRPGVSRDGKTAVVWWAHLVRMDHLGTCGASRGGTLLLRKNAQGAWEVDRPLTMFIS
ncbi:MAG: hypothetical protein KY467_01400 [Gemmatimonadetes bacterium]|nr:hypothetical protein [Gemmatimonadota bacterium]